MEVSFDSGVTVFVWFMACAHIDTSFFAFLAKLPKFTLYQGVWKSQKKSHSTLRAKRTTFTFWVDKSFQTIRSLNKTMFFFIFSAKIQSHRFAKIGYRKLDLRTWQISSVQFFMPLMFLLEFLATFPLLIIFAKFKDFGMGSTPSSRITSKAQNHEEQSMSMELPLFCSLMSIKMMIIFCVIN